MIEIMVVTALVAFLGATFWGYFLPWFRIGLPAQALATDVQTIAAQLPGFAERWGGFQRRLPFADGTRYYNVLIRLVGARLLDKRFVCEDARAVALVQVSVPDCTVNPLGAKYRHLSSWKTSYWPHSMVLEILLRDDDPDVDLADDVVTIRKLVLDRLQDLLDDSPTMTTCRKDNDDDSLLYVRMSLTEKYHRNLVALNSRRLFGWNPALCVLPST